MLFQGYRAKRVKHHRGYTRGFLLVLALFMTVSNAVAANITGTVYQADGTTQLVGESVVVAAYTGDPCGLVTEVASTTSSAVDGSYTITIADGDYFVRTSNLNGGGAGYRHRFSVGCGRDHLR